MHTIALKELKRHAAVEIQFPILYEMQRPEDWRSFQELAFVCNSDGSIDAEVANAVNLALQANPEIVITELSSRGRETETHYSFPSQRVSVVSLQNTPLQTDYPIRR